MAFLDVVLFIPTAGSTTDWVVSAAIQGYRTPAAAGAVNGLTYAYRAESADLSQWEVGFGTYSSGTTTLARTTVVANSAGTTAKINFSAPPNVGVVELSKYMLAFDSAMTLTAPEQAQALTNLGAGTVGITSFAAATTLVGRTAIGALGNLTAVRVFTAGSAWAKPAGLNYIRVMGIGAGGSGGGTQATGAAQQSCGGGGGAGTYAEINSILASALGSSETVNVSAGPSGTSGAAGTAGTASSFGAFLSCPGGSGGGIGVPVAGATNQPLGAAGAGGIAASGTPGPDFSSRGSAGGYGVTTSAAVSISGMGAPGWAGQGASASVTTASGNAGNAPGAGGSGAGSGASNGARPGGAGGPGMIVVEEYS